MQIFLENIFGEGKGLFEYIVLSPGDPSLTLRMTRLCEVMEGKEGSSALDPSFHHPIQISVSSRSVSEGSYGVSRI